MSLKGILAVAALTTGCATDKPTTAISRRQYVDFPDAKVQDTITR